MITPYIKKPTELFTIIVVENYYLQRFPDAYRMAINVLDHIIYTFNGAYKYTTRLTDEDILSCNTEFAIVMKIGTRFNIRVLLDNFDYEKVSLMGHILDKKHRYYALHDQCFIIKVCDYDTTPTPTLRKINRSSQNFHDDYTPLWIEDGGEEIEIMCDLHGETLPSGGYLISNLLRNGKIVQPFNKAIRADKKYLYVDLVKNCVHPQKLDQFQKKNHKVFAWSTESQYNRNEIDITPYEHFIGCANGLQALLYTHADLKSVTFCDINPNAIEFTRRLIYEWNPNTTGYAQFCDDQQSYANFQMYSVVDGIKIPLHKMTHEYLNEYFFNIIDMNEEIFDVIEKIRQGKIQCNLIEANMLDIDDIRKYIENKRIILYFSNVASYSITNHKVSMLDVDIHIKRVKSIVDRESIFIGNSPEQKYAPQKSDVSYSILNDYHLEVLEQLNYPWRKNEFDDYKRRVGEISTNFKKRHNKLET